MNDRIYEQILKNSREGFLKIKGTKYKNEKYIDFDVVEYNESFIDILKKILKKNKIDLNSIKNIISNNFDRNRQGIKVEQFLENIEKKQFESINFGQESYGITLCVEGYYLKDYFIVICKSNFQQEIFRFTEVLDKSKDIYFWMKDAKGNYITVNQAWLDEVGFSDKSMVEGLNSYDVWPKPQCDVFRANEEEVLKDNLIKIFQEKFEMKKGIKNLDTTIWPLLDEDENPIGTMGIAINGKSRAEFYDNLNKNEQTFKEITQYCDSVFFIRDEQKIIYMSPAYEKMFEDSWAYYENDVYKFNDFFKTEEKEKGILYDYDFNKVNEGRAKAKLKNGKEKWIQYKFLPIHNENGESIKRIGMLTDVTKDVNLEEEKEKLRLDFFANISHELRTPVNLILSSIQVLKLKLDTLDKNNYDYFSTYINIMQQNTFRLVKLINNLIDSTKLDSNNIKIHTINGDIISFIEDTCSSVVNFIKSKNMNLVFDTDSEEEIISFDPNFVERIILNLLSNAIKFNKENGTIFVNITSNEKEITVEVKDEGPGIPRDKIPTIFERFEQVRSKMKSEREGSGIGLYIVKALVKMHNGTVKINCEEGEGCSIIFALPNKINENKTYEDRVYRQNKINMIDIEFSDIYL